MVEMPPEEIGEEEPRSSMAELMDEEYSYHRPRRGDIRRGTIVRKDPDSIIVDIGGKRDGIVPSRDLDRLGPEAVAEIQVGDEMPVYIMHPETRDGDTIVSLNLARQAMDWDRAQKLMESEEVFEGEVSGYNKGGLLVPFGRLQGFLPASQIANLNGRVEGGSHLERLAQMVGRSLPLKVIEVSRHRRRLILSERAAQREWRARQREKLFKEIEEGEVRRGVVSNLCDFGAFVDLGGADGLIHISELAWNRVRHPREVLDVGREVEVLVLKADRERQRIALSLKRLQADPWRSVEEKYQVGQVVWGTITNIVKFGAFAEIEPGIEGLIHLSELVEGGIQEPTEVVYEGEELPLQVVSVDGARQRIGLSLRRVSPEMRGERAEEEAAVTETELEQAEEPQVEAEGVASPEALSAEVTPEAPGEEITVPLPPEADETVKEEALVVAKDGAAEEPETESEKVQEEQEKETALAPVAQVAGGAEQVQEEPVAGVSYPMVVEVAGESERVQEEQEEEVATAPVAQVAGESERVQEEPEARVSLPMVVDVAGEAEVGAQPVQEEQEKEASQAAVVEADGEVEAEAEQVQEQQDAEASPAPDVEATEETDAEAGDVQEAQEDGELGS